MSSPTSIADLRKKFSSSIDPHEIDLFLARATGKSREFLWAHSEYILSPQEKSCFTRFVHRRQKHEPVAHILGSKEFFGLDFKVNKHTLIPRPETELMIEEIMSYEKSNIQSEESKKKKTLIADIGTGSGNIIISLAKQFLSNESEQAKYEFFGLDISSQALRIARNNAKRHDAEKDIIFKRSDLLSTLLPLLRQSEKYSRVIIAANLPYLSKEIYQSSMPDVKKFEPKSALYSPEHGLQHYRKLFNQIKDLLQAQTQISFSLFLEISPEQKPLLSKISKQFFPGAKIIFKKDLAYKWRLAHIALQR